MQSTVGHSFQGSSSDTAYTDDGSPRRRRPARVDRLELDHRRLRKATARLVEVVNRQPADPSRNPIYSIVIMYIMLVATDDPEPETPRGEP